MLVQFSKRVTAISLYLSYLKKFFFVCLSSSKFSVILRHSRPARTVLGSRPFPTIKDGICGRDLTDQE